jgi:hypothetical protein
LLAELGSHGHIIFIKMVIYTKILQADGQQLQKLGLLQVLVQLEDAEYLIQ